METLHQLKGRSSSLVFHYGLAILSVASALVITQSLKPTVFPTPLFIAAIVITTWSGGTGPGLVAVISATLLLEFCFVSPVPAFALHTTHIPYLVQFVVPALLSGWFTQKRREAEAALKEAHDQLEFKVQERTAQLQGANEQLQSEITERRRAEEAVYKMQADLAHVTRVMTMSELTSSIAHEVNQPLAAIVTNGAAGLRWLAADPPCLERARDSMTCIINEGTRASEVIRRIRLLSKKTSLQKSALAINEVVQEVIALTEPELLKHLVSLNCNLETGLPSVLGDRVQLQQVLLNLIINSITAMEKTAQCSRELLVTSGIWDRDQVLVSVRDSGMGLHPPQLEHIFDAFFTTKPDGVGMGLSISRTIVEAHGGRLWACINNGPGATFHFTLPALRDDCELE
ncbi:MAG: histidine kinase [Candidatus Angelobacter sp.]|jgi:C4-dicarboxylate-specific signal transduction histidine kinase|nr:histidine kinase [Candidatus Angelobacter sp.]